MSVRSCSGNFVGLRVQRSVGQETHVKHYSFRIPVYEDGTTKWRDATDEERKELLAQAETYDKELLALQVAAKKQAQSEKGFDPFSARNNTGVRGISYRVNKDSLGYDVEAFWLSLTHNGKTHSSNVRLANRSWKDGWALIVHKLVALKDLDAATERKLLKAIPDEKKLKADLKKKLAAKAAKPKKEKK